MNRLWFLLLALQLLPAELLFGQKDLDFWFVVPAVTRNHCNGAPYCNTGASPTKFIITTYELPSTVTVTQPANDISLFPVTGFTPIIINIPANSSYVLQLWSHNFSAIPSEAQMRKNVENRPAYGSEATPMNKGIHITATNYIGVYYSEEEPYNPETFTLKGRNALGTDFFASFQTNKGNHYFDPTLAIYGPGSNTKVEPFISAIDIVATDPGTTQVWVYPRPGQQIEGWGTVSPDSFLVNLQYGQTISLMPKDYYKAGALSAASATPARHLTGTRIKTRNGKRIAVTLKDDSVDGDTGCWEIGRASCRERV
jgi:hypothetical protein